MNCEDNIQQNAVRTVSKACCSRPPIVLRGGFNHTPTGEYVDFGGLKTYVTGPKTAKRGILFIYDVFGLFIQTLRGADILASGFPLLPDTAGTYRVFMPDFFGSNPADLSTYPAKTPADIAGVQAFFAGPANPATDLERIAPLMKAIKEKHPNIEEWAVFGTCWGTKLAALLAREGTEFKAAGQAHPSLVELGDAKKVVIPMVVLPSVDEVPEEIDPWIEALKEVSVASYAETFFDMPHGWMTSRADFENQYAFEEYLRGYRIIREFFAQHMN